MASLLQQGSSVRAQSVPSIWFENAAATTETREAPQFDVGTNAVPLPNDFESPLDWRPKPANVSFSTAPASSAADSGSKSQDAPKPTNSFAAIPAPNGEEPTGAAVNPLLADFEAEEQSQKPQVQEQEVRSLAKATSQPEPLRTPRQQEQLYQQLMQEETKLKTLREQLGLQESGGPRTAQVAQPQRDVALIAPSVARSASAYPPEPLQRGVPLAETSRRHVTEKEQATWQVPQRSPARPLLQSATAQAARNVVPDAEAFFAEEAEAGSKDSAWTSPAFTTNSNALAEQSLQAKPVLFASETPHSIQHGQHGWLRSFLHEAVREAALARQHGTDG